MRRSLIKALCLLILIIIVIKGDPVNAGSADIKIYSDAGEYRVGDSIVVYIEIEADVVPGDFEGSLFYPPDILKHVPSSNLTTGGDGVLNIYDHVTKGDRKNRKYALKFEAISSGSVKIYLKGSEKEGTGGYNEDPEVYELEEGYGMSISRNDLEFKVIKDKQEPDETVVTKEPKEDPKITPEPEDEPEVTGEPVKDPPVTAKPDEGNMNDKAEIDTNAIGIQAVSDGTVVKLISRGEFTLGHADDVEIPKGYKSTSIKIDGINIPVFVKDDGRSDSYILIVLKDRNGEDALYDYDRLEKTLQKHVPETEKSEEQRGVALTDSIEALELSKSYDKSLSTLTLIIAGLSALTMALIIIVIRLAVKNRKDELERPDYGAHNHSDKACR